MVNGNYEYEIYQMKLKALEELEKLNGIEIDGITFFMDIEKLRKELEDSRERVPCRCMQCYLLTF